MIINEIIKRRILNLEPKNMERYFEERELSFNKNSAELLSRILQEVELDMIDNFANSLENTVLKIKEYILKENRVTIEVKLDNTSIVFHDETSPITAFKRNFKDKKSKFFVFESNSFDEHRLIEALSINSLTKTNYMFFNTNVEKIYSFIQNTIEIFDNLNNKTIIIDKENKDFFDNLKNNEKKLEETLVFEELQKKINHYINLMRDETESDNLNEDQNEKFKIFEYSRKLLKNSFSSQPLSINQVVDYKNKKVHLQEMKLNDLRMLELKIMGFPKGSSLYHLFGNVKSEILESYDLILEELKGYKLSKMDNVFFNVLIEFLHEKTKIDLLEEIVFNKYKKLSEEEKSLIFTEKEYTGGYSKEFKGMILSSELRERNYSDSLLTRDNQTYLLLPISIFEYEAKKRYCFLRNENNDSYSKDSGITFTEALSGNINKEIFAQKIQEMLKNDEIFNITSHSFLGMPKSNEARININYINKYIREINLLSSLENNNNQQIRIKKKL